MSEATPVEVLMFGPHNTDAAHQLAIDVTNEALNNAMARGAAQPETPPYYVVLGLLRAAGRLGTHAMPGYAAGLIPMLQLILDQEQHNTAVNDG